MYFQRYKNVLDVFISPSKDDGVLNKWLNRVADALKRLAGNAVEALPAIVGSVVDAILRFLGVNTRRDSELESIDKAKNLGFRVYDHGMVTYEEKKLGLSAYYDIRIRVMS